MPYYYKRRYRRRPYRRFYRKKKGGWASTAYKALGIASRVASLVNAEWKHFDVTGNGAITSGSPLVIALTAIGQGDSDITRDGNSILPKQLNVRLELAADSSSTSTQVRCILLKDKQSDGSAPTWTQVLENTGQMFTSPIDLDTGGSRFQIYMDKVINLPYGTKPNMFLQKFMKFNKPNANRKRWSHIKWTGSNSTDYEDGHMFLLLCSNEPTNDPSYELYSRLRFIDN